MSKANRNIAEVSPVERAALVARLKREAAEKSRRRTIPRRRGAGSSVPLSFAQQRLWFFSQLEPESTFYNIPAIFSLSGSLNVEALRDSLDEILRRHEALRTSFQTIDGEPRQVVADEATLPLPLFDLSGLSNDERDGEVRRLKLDARRPFNLEEAPLVRACLLRLNADEHLLFLTMHHIVSDGWSLGIILSELAALYRAYVEGTREALPELPVQYSDFAAWQREWLTGEVLERQLGYWKHQLKGALPVLELPTDKPRPGVQTFRGAHLVCTVGDELTRELRALSRRQGATLYMTLLAVFKTLLHRYTGQREIIVGTPIANRNLIDIESLVGFFVNTLVLRTSLEPRLSFEELLSRVRETTLGAYAHQDVPFEKLVEELQPKRSLSHSPLFQLMFSLQNAPMPSLELPRLSLKLLDDEAETSQFDLTLDITEEAGELLCTLEYNTDLFEHATARRIFTHYENLLKAVARDPRQRLSQLPMLTRVERQRLLLEYNDTARKVPRCRCIHELFEEQASRTPEAVAVAYEDERLTYAELNRRANRLAHYLRELGVEPETRVGILLDRSLEVAVALLGVLKAGGLYVPLDPAYPQERLRFMLSEANVAVLLTERRLTEELPTHNARVVCLDRDAHSIAERDGDNPTNVALADNLAYLIYTSGTTGQPKGILIPHGALVNSIFAFITQHRIAPQDCILQFASLSFDVAAEELFAAWLAGATAVMRPGEVIATHAEFVALLESQGVTIVNLPASFWAEWLGALEEGTLGLPKTLRRVVVGNEKTLGETLDRWRALVGEAVEWNNAYGPSETTITASNFEPARASSPAQVSHVGSVPIGRPVINAQMFILDGSLQPVPQGVAGELYIGGAGLARGYDKQPAQTAERFIPNPYSLRRGARLYRTGDLARHLPDGNIEFLGRVDEQVKIRGFRIELGEIEAALLGHPQVKEASVIARETQGGEKRLVAYVVASAEEDIGEPLHQELRRYLSEYLPEYMLPQAFVRLAELPMTPNGKVDRKALPLIESVREGAAETFVAPRSEMERIIAGVWREMLSLEQVGINDNFFNLGGHSLLMVHVNNRLREILRRELSMIEMFRYPTVGALAEHLSRQSLEAPRPPSPQNSSEMRRQAMTRQRQLKQKRRAERQPSPTRD